MADYCKIVYPEVKIFKVGQKLFPGMESALLGPLRL